jgi:uncharacterized tellurite resistance protein B-like protein
MNSRVASMPVESFFDRLRRMDVPYADVLARFRDVLSETRLCGRQHVHLGKIVGNEMLEFMESDPDMPAGVQLEAALRGFLQLAPFLGSVLSPLSAEVESQGFGRTFGHTEFRQKTDNRALVFLRRTADILNLTRNLMDTNQGTMSLDVVSFDEPALFELDTAENPFDLDDLTSFSPTSLAVAKVLVKISLADGNFRDPEKIMIAQTLEHMGETLSESQCERLAAEASKESVQEILQVVADQPVMFKEKLLLLAMLATAADGRVETIEKKLLGQAAPLLGISRHRFSEIAKDAVSLIKTRQVSLTESAGSIARSAVQIGQLQPVLPLSRAPRAPQPAHGDLATPEERGQDPGPTAAQKPTAETAIAHRASETPLSIRTPPPPPSPVEPPPISRQETPSAPKIWRCPACQMPQFQEFDECPQCGVIVSKFREKQDRGWPGSRDVMVELPGDPPLDQKAQTVRQKPDHERSGPSLCSGCREHLPAGAKFCPSCGTRVT